jgi:hypothetical protein
MFLNLTEIHNSPETRRGNRGKVIRLHQMLLKFLSEDYYPYAGADLITQRTHIVNI